MFVFVGSTATWKPLTPSGMPFDFVQVFPRSVERYAPRPANVVPPPKTSLPVRTTIAPPFAMPTPPAAWVGRLSPIERQVDEPLSMSQTPPRPPVAKRRPVLESYAKWLIRPARSASPLFSTRVYPALSPISGPLPYGFQLPLEPETELPRAAIRAFWRSAAAYAPGLATPVRRARSWLTANISAASPV